MKNIPVYIVGTLLAALLACGKESTKEETTPEDKKETSKDVRQESGEQVELTAEQFRTAGIVTGGLVTKNLNGVLHVNGLLDAPPQSLASVSAPLGGFIRSTDMLPGNRVNKGQVIAIIENPDFIQFQQDYLESTSRLEYLQLEYDRQKELYAQNVAAAKTFQLITADYKTMQARVSGLKEKLQLIGIHPDKLTVNNVSRTVPVYAPITGYVTAVHVNIGKYVQPTDVMFSIANTEHLHAELTVFEQDISKIRKGQKVRFTLPNEGTRERKATIYLIGREIGPDRTVNVHAHMDEEDTQLLPGIYVSALIETIEEQVPALPEEAIVQSEGKDFVFVYTGKTQKAAYLYRRVEVRKGVSEGGYSAVTLPDNVHVTQTPIVLKGAYSLLSKMKNSEEEE